MFSKSNVLATLIGGISMFVLGYVLWELLGETLFEGHILTNVMKETPDYIHLVIGCIISAFALSTLYAKWVRGHHSAKEGAEFGLWIGIFFGLGEGLIQFATSEELTFTGYLINTILNIVFFVVIGVVIATIYKATSKKAKN